MRHRHLISSAMNTAAELDADCETIESLDDALNHADHLASALAGMLQDPEHDGDVQDEMVTAQRIVNALTLINELQS